MAQNHSNWFPTRTPTPHPASILGQTDTGTPMTLQLCLSACRGWSFRTKTGALGFSGVGQGALFRLHWRFSGAKNILRCPAGLPVNWDLFVVCDRWAFLSYPHTLTLILNYVFHMLSWRPFIWGIMVCTSSIIFHLNTDIQERMH